MNFTLCDWASVDHSGRWGCHALAWLSKGHVGNQEEAEVAGAAHTVVASLHAHRGSQAVQWSGCWALGHMGNQTALWR